MSTTIKTLGEFIEIHNAQWPLRGLWDMGHQIHIILCDPNSSKRLSELTKSPCATCELRAQWPKDNQTILAYSGMDSSDAQLFCTHGKPSSRLNQADSLSDLSPFLDTPAKPLILKKGDSISCPIWK